MMNSHEISNDCRRFLILATSGAGGMAALGMTTPFVASSFPSEKTEATGAAVEIDAGRIESGQMITAKWQSKPVWAVNYTVQQPKDLRTLDSAVSDPKSEVEQQLENCKNETRSTKPNIFMAIGICTYLGCSPIYRPGATPADLESAWKGGFFYPYHDSKFSMTKHVYKGVPAPTNLIVPPHKYLSDTTVLVGEAQK